MSVMCSVAKKKTVPEPAKKRPGPAPSGRRANSLSIKAAPEWYEWVKEGAEHCRTDVAKLIDAALIDYLKRQGFEKPAPRR